MNFPCPSKIDCFGTDNPFANLSAEAPDQEVFFGWYNGAPWLQPILGSNWTQNSCAGLCESDFSQAEADLCAAIANATCMFVDWGPPGIYVNGGPRSGPPIVPPPGTGTPVYLNNIAQCTIHCPDGNPFTYQVRAGLFPGINQATADAAARSYACNLANINAVCLGSISTKACLGTAYNQTIASSRPGIFTFIVISGSLPPGLSLTPGPAPTGAISGTPTATGSFTFTLRVTSAAGNFMQKTYTINVMGFDQTSLPDGRQGSLYSQSLTITGGTAPYLFSVELGALPAGLTLSDAGLLDGTPTESGDFDVTIGVTDAGSAFCTKAFTLHVDPDVCPDFNGTDWKAAGTYSEATGGAGIIACTFLPISGGVSFDMDAIAPDSLVDAAVAQTLQNYTLTPGSTCNCRIVFQATVVGPANRRCLAVQINDNVSGALVNVDLALSAPGVYNFDIPFSISPLATALTVIMSVQAPCGLGGFGGTYESHLVGTLKNV